MAIFELVARNQMYLGEGNIIPKGERLTMNIHQMGVNQYNLMTNPESRRQVMQQFAIHGIELKPNSPYLNAGHWEISQRPEGFAKAMTSEVQSFNPFGEFKLPWNETPTGNEVINDVEMKKGCIEVVQNFFGEGLDMDFAEKGFEGRCEIASSFYDEVKEQMGIDAKLDFSDMPKNSLGGYDPATNKMELNSSFLENNDCRGLMNTILHESRHAFQNKCIQNPDSVTVKQNIIDVWKDNFNNYFSPQDDFEAYENQEIEKDANYFADSVMRKGELVYG